MSIFDIFRRKKEEKPSAGLVPLEPFPTLPAAPRSVFEILAPVEQGAPVFLPPIRREPDVFEIIERPREPERFVDLPAGPATPRRKAPEASPAQVVPARIQSPPRGLPSIEWLDQVFGLRRLWEMIRSGREEPEFEEAVKATERGGRLAELPLFLVAPTERGAEERTAKFLGIPVKRVEALKRAGRDPWSELLNPTLYDVERALLWAMPDDIPGTLSFGLNDPGEFGLMYFEESPLI